jgi:hypothetical protein
MISFARLQRILLNNLSNDVIDNLKNIINNADNSRMVPETWVYHKQNLYTYVKSIKVIDLKKYLEQIAN